MELELKDIKELMEDFQRGTCTRMNLSIGQVHLELEKNVGPLSTSMSIQPATGESVKEPESSDASSDADLVKAPLMGTFYVAAGPGEKPYVVKGQMVKAGDVIGLIEAMKVMNEIPAPYDGVVEEILSGDGQLVSPGQALIRLKGQNHV